MQKYFVLHGHFYQPPRENPWSGFVDRQISAAPFPDWNSRIHQECYAACASAPVLDNGKVSSVINCYEYLSFNFGPTLLEWMDRHDPQTVKRIIEADRISAARCQGHGNAIAQVFNHMIMPLADAKDQYTQALWGLQDFRRRFGRDSEGLWLGETAINDETAAILVDCGVKYVILSPYQAGSYTDNGVTHNAEGARIETGRAYRLPTKNGVLAVFFYDGPMASGVSFGDLLTDAAHLDGAVKSAAASKPSWAPLVHTATDGEVYGHHKAFGNMALARFIDKNIRSSSPEFVFTNYGAFLEEHPPVLECSLLPGKEGLGTSWSCAHGVGRWREDCSCHTGGLDSWNQKWRTPLREALDLLRNAIWQAAEERLSPLLKDIWAARNDYHTPYALKTPQSIEQFFKSHQKHRLSKEERRLVMGLMEGLRFAMLMYTSCGWFFSDISGIETIQDLLYAQRAYEYFAPYLPKGCLEQYSSLLASARSNIAAQGSGEEILRRSLEETQINPQTLRRSLVLSCAFSEIPADTGPYAISWVERSGGRGILLFTSPAQGEVYAAFRAEGGRILHKEMDSLPRWRGEGFWKDSSSWQNLAVGDLPLFLRLGVLARNIKTEAEQGYHSSRAETSLPPSAFTGLEKYLLPDEKTLLTGFLYNKITAFSGKSEIDGGQIDAFHGAIGLYKALSGSKESLEQAASMMIRALTPLLRRSLREKTPSVLKMIRLILWEVRDRVCPELLTPLQDMLYRASLSEPGCRSNGGLPEFYAEFRHLMKDLNFSGE